MNRILYITTVDKSTDPGVYKKIEYQSNSFRKLGYDVANTFYDNKELYIYNEKYLGVNKYKVSSLFERFLYDANIIDAVKKDIDNFDIVYIRKSFVSFKFISFLRFLKNQNKKVIIEIPTYPYRKELTGFLRQIFYGFEFVSSFFIKKHVDFITFFGHETKEIWGVPALKLENGIDVGSIRVCENKNHDGYNFIAVANLAKWHGYERLILSISKLDIKTRKRIRFNIVGDGTEKKYLENLVDSLNLNENVIFHGIKCGNELDNIFDMSNIGVGSLGMYKIGLNQATTLKAREFTARGLPFILGYPDCSFPLNTDFVYQVSNNSELFDLRSFIEWYDDLKIDINQIRDYANKYLTWDKQISKIINKLESDTND